MNSSRLTVHVAASVSEIDRDELDRVLDGRSPFLDPRWLGALEQSGAVGPQTGWTPAPVVVSRDERIVGFAPAYLKTDSFGEFVHDWAWADYARRAHIPYYPKLVVTSPFSPATGPRLLVAPDEDPGPVRAALAQGLVELARATRVSGIHILFAPLEEIAALEAFGFFERNHVQYHFTDRGFGNFDGFVAALNSKRRRECRRERRSITDRGIRIEAVPGSALTAEQTEDLVRFYASTCERYVWGRQYLPRDFFVRVIRELPDSILAFFAVDAHGTRIAGTFNVRGGDRLYGRYWGADVDVPNLHFETCYYAMIEFALAHGIRVIEPGAGGEHKRARGFEPTVTRSAHLMLDAHLQRVLSSYCERERTLVAHEIENLASGSPYRADELG